MKRGKSSGRAVFAGVAATAAVALSLVLAPLSATATDSDLKHSYAFKLEASHGYTVIALVASQRADGQGDLALLVFKPGSSVIYGAPALVTATRIESDLGPIGQVSLDVLPSGRTRTLRSDCGDEPERATIEPQLFRGSVELHGEEGYAEAASTSPREYAAFFLRFLCPGAGPGEVSGAGLAGARLRLRAHRRDFHLNLQANKNRPGARTRFEIETREERRGISISRSRTFWLGSSAFDFDPSLRTATLAPTAPFSGRATFHRDAASAKRWTGDLAVDLPGRSEVPLVGPRFAAALRPACWRQGEGRFRCEMAPHIERGHRRGH